MDSLFCKNCGSTGPARYSLGKLFSVIGLIFVFFALIALTGQYPLSALGGFFLCAAIAGLCFAVAYSTRSLFCGSCGSLDLLPAHSPKAQEFQLRHQVFGHASRHIEARAPQPEIQYRGEKNITPPVPTPPADDPLFAFRDPRGRREPHS